MKLALSKTTLVNVYFFAFIAILLNLWIRSIRTGYAKESWLITDFLINYQGGFVRRGLPGEILLSLYRHTGLHPYHLIIVTCILAYALLIGFFVRKFIAGGYPVFTLPFVFFIGNPLISDFWVRKDVLLMLFFISVIHFSSRKNHPRLIAINLLLILGLLTHESIGFFSLPVLCLILAVKRGNPAVRAARSRLKSLVVAALQLSPSIVAFGCVLHFKGSPSVSEIIWNSWKPVTFPVQSEVDGGVPAAIDALSWPLEKGLSLMSLTFRNFRDDIYAPLAWFFILVLVYYILTNTDSMNFKLLTYRSTTKFNKTNLSNILIFQFVTVIPLFVLAWDYGRWVFYWVLSAFAIMLVVPEKDLSALFPDRLSAFSASLNRVLDAFFSKSKSFLFLLCILIGVPGVSWSLVAYINTVSLVVVLRHVSGIAHAVLLRFQAFG